MGRSLSTAFLLALFVATAGAFAVTRDATVEPSPIYSPRVPAVFSPACGCPDAAASFDFLLRKPDRLTVWVERDGKRVRTLLNGRSFGAGLVPVVFDGLTENGLTLPAGDYRPVVRLERAHRTIELPQTIALDLTPPAVRVAHRIYSHISPDGDGRKDVFSVPYRLNERGRAVLLVDGRQALVAPVAARRGVLHWNGRIGGRVLAPGNHVLRIAAEDLAGNRARPFPFAVVQIRYLRLGRDRVLAKPGTHFAVLALTDAEQVSWLFNRRRGVAGPGTLRFRAPKRPGVYRLYVTAAGHSAKALVVVA